MKYLLLAALIALGMGIGCASTPEAASIDCCHKPDTKAVESVTERDARRHAMIADGKAYYDETGKFHDHATTAMVWTVCNCKVCDRADKCCGPQHCVCNPN